MKHVCAYLALVALVVLASCSRSASRSDMAEILRRLESVAPHDLRDFDAHGEPDRARAGVLRLLEAEGVAAEGAEEELAELAFRRRRAGRPWRCYTCSIPSAPTERP